MFWKKQQQMFWSLFIFREHSAQEKIERGLEKMQVNGPEEYKKKARKKSVAVSVACMATY